MNNEQQCKCELDGFQGAVWKGDCPLHKDDDKFIPHTNNNWEEEISKEIRAIIKAPLRSQFSTSDIVIGHWSSTTLSEKIHDLKELFRQELTKKDQEHKAELEIIKGEIEENTRSKGINPFIDEDGIKEIVSILDSHINK